MALQWNLEDPGSIYAEPFELKPAMFKLNAGEVTTLEVTNKQFLDEVFMISRIIKVEVGTDKPIRKDIWSSLYSKL